MKTFLFILICFVALSSLLTGIILMSVPDGSMMRLPVSLLNATVFKDFRLPGFFLFLFVGGTNIYALFSLLIENRNQYSISLIAGLTTVLWMILQWMLIENTLFTDLVYFLIGAAVVFMSLQLKGKSLI